MNRISSENRKYVVFGMAFLALALNFTRYLHPAWLSPDAKDGVFGLLMGLGIGLNLLAVWRSRRGRKGCA